MVTAYELSHVSPFAGLSEGELEIIVPLCEEVICRRGEALFREGQMAERVYILLEGKVTIQVQLTSRPENVTVAISDRADNLVGWSGLVAPYCYTASAICQADSRLVAVDGQSLLRVLGQDAQMGFVVIQRIAEVISSRLRNTRAALLKTM